MESASQSDNPPEYPHSRLAVFMGVVIALATLVLPVFAIARFSSARVTPLDSSQYPIFRARE